MIVNTGRRIQIEIDGYHFSRDCDTPGCVSVVQQCAATNARIELPTNLEDAEEFINAYRRAVAEDIKYRQSEVE